MAVQEIAAVRKLYRNRNRTKMTSIPPTISEIRKLCRAVTMNRAGRKMPESIWIFCFANPAPSSLIAASRPRVTVNRVGAILCRNHQNDRWTALDRSRTEARCRSFGYVGNIAEGEICALPLKDYGIR